MWKNEPKKKKGFGFHLLTLILATIYIIFLSNQIISFNKAIEEKDHNICKNISDRLIKERCYYDVAVLTQNKEICQNIKSRYVKTESDCRFATYITPPNYSVTNLKASIYLTFFLIFIIYTLSFTHKDRLIEYYMKHGRKIVLIFSVTILFLTTFIYKFTMNSPFWFFLSNFYDDSVYLIIRLVILITLSSLISFLVKKTYEKSVRYFQ